MRAQRAPLRPTVSPARLCRVVYAGFWRSDGDYPCVGQQISRRDIARSLSPSDLRTTLPEVRPASDIKALPSHTPAKATTDGKRQLAAVAHPKSPKLDSKASRAPSAAPWQAILDNDRAWHTPRLPTPTRPPRVARRLSHCKCEINRGRRWLRVHDQWPSANRRLEHGQVAARRGDADRAVAAARRAEIIRHRHGRPWHQARCDRAVRQPHQRPALRRRRNLQQKPAHARTQSRVGEMGGAYWAPHQRRAGEEGGEIAHGAKVTDPRHTRRRGGAPVAETDDEHYCEHIKHFRRGAS